MIKILLYSSNGVSKDLYQAFSLPVDKVEYPDYYEKIKHPMNLNKIYENSKNKKYKTKNEIEKDLALIRDNCRIFCERTFPDLVILAEQLYDEAKSILDDFTSRENITNKKYENANENENENTHENNILIENRE